MKKIQLFLLQFLLISITQHTNAQLPVKTEYTVEWGNIGPILKMVIYGQGLHIQCH